MRRKRNRKKIDELNCTISSEIEEREKNKVNCMESHEKQLSNKKHSSVQLKDTPDEFLYSRNSVSTSSEHDKDSDINFTSDVDTNDSQMAQPLKTVSTCDLLLDCQEESLCPVQQNFYSEEWLKYVKYTATLSQIPSLSAVNGSDVGEKIPSGRSTPKELPVLYFSNTVQQPQIAVPPPYSSVMIGNPIISTPGITTVTTLSGSSMPIIHSVSRPPFLPRFAPVFSSLLRATIASSSAASNASPVVSNVFPVKLERVTCGLSSETNEEILPLISIDSKIENFIYNTENSTEVTPVVSSPLQNSRLMELVQENSNVPSPSCSNDSGSDHSITPDLLSKMEVNFEESENNSLPNTPSEVNIPLPTGSEENSNDVNGPKIVGIVSADAGGASVFFQDADIMQVKMVEFDPNSKKAKDTSNTNGAVPAVDVLPKVVTQWSIFSMQKTIAVISSGSVEPTTHNLLALRPHIPPASAERYPGTKLKIRLREENFLTLSIWWLIEKRYLPLNPPCASCFGKSFQICSSRQYRDGLCWICENLDCGKIYPVKRPKFFEQFPHFSLEELLLLIYHWSVQSPIWVILKDVQASEQKVWEYFTALQGLCGRYVREHYLFGKGRPMNNTIEASAVKLGKFFILCAFDRDEGVSRLEALTTEEACNSMKHIEILDSWLTRSCKLITWRKISDQFLTSNAKYAADPTITDFKNPAQHILNASKYLGKTMVQLFQNICHDKLSIEIVQLILDEVQWRERRGKSEEAAFWNILNEISSLNESYYYTEAKLGNITSDRYFYKADLSFQMRWGPYDIGEKTSSSYSASSINDDIKEAISSCISSCTNKLLDCRIAPSPSSKKSAGELGDLKSNHPICIDQSIASTSYSPRNPEPSLLKTQDLLSVRIIFNNSDKAQIAAKTEAVNLGKHLKKEGYLTSPVRWLARKKLIEVEMPCYVCQNKAILLDNSKFPDGVSWMCQKNVCRFQNRYRRPTFFACFGFRLELIFAIIYHWAVQSDYKTLIKSVPMNELNIISVQRKLQKVCAAVAQKNAFKLGGSKFIVEVALVKFSNCFILGAMERETKLSRLQAYSIQTKLHIDNIRRTLLAWLHPETTVVVNSNKYLGSYSMDEKIHLVFADKSIQNVQSKKFHTLTISNYLQNHMRVMFGNFNVQSMSSDILQVYLDELVWRERYGGTPSLAFKNIIRHVFTIYESANSTFFTSPSSSNKEELILRDAAVYYDLPYPPPKCIVCLERLPEYVIQRYKSTGGLESPQPSSSNVHPPSDSDGQSEKETPLQETPLQKIPLQETPLQKTPLEETPLEETPLEETPLQKTLLQKTLLQKTLLQKTPLQKTPLQKTPLQETPLQETPLQGGLESSLSSVHPLSDSDSQSEQETPQEASLQDAEPYVVDKKIKEEIVSDDEIELLQDDACSKESESSSSSNTANAAQNLPTNSLDKSIYNVYYNNPTKLSVKKSDSYYSRYSNKCYSSKRKAEDGFSATKFRCIECKNTVSKDHFKKMYTCTDCKYYKYSTFCQKAYAHHRYYVLFGRKMVSNSSECTGFHHPVSLTESWNCSCGFSTQDGNELASHLVNCDHDTCYMHIDVSEPHVL